MTTADEFRQVVRSLPETEERETWGHPTFRVRDKMFATLSDDGREATVKATRQEQAALVAASPETFGVPAYVGRHGWVGVQLATVDPVELRELPVEAWRQTASRRLVTAYDAEHAAHEPGSDAEALGGVVAQLGVLRVVAQLESGRPSGSWRRRILLATDSRRSLGTGV
jgi:hypothetical protein